MSAYTTEEYRLQLEDIYGEVWDTTQLTETFRVEGFLAPFVVVVNKATGERGTLQFQARPRFYHSFEYDGLQLHKRVRRIQEGREL